MEISEKLFKFKFHILFSFAFALAILSFVYLVPSFLGVLAYFWPLLVSTALFLVAVVVIGRTSTPAAEAPGEKAGEGLLDFVAGRPGEELVHAAEESSTSEQKM